MTNRRKPEQRSTGTAWKPTRPRAELVKAIGAGTGIVAGTALLIFLMKPADSTATAPATDIPTPTQPAATTPTQPAGSTTPTQAPDTTPTTPATTPAP